LTFLPVSISKCPTQDNQQGRCLQLNCKQHRPAKCQIDVIKHTTRPEYGLGSARRLLVVLLDSCADWFVPTIKATAEKSYSISRKRVCLGMSVRQIPKPVALFSEADLIIIKHCCMRGTISTLHDLFSKSPNTSDSLHSDEQCGISRPWPRVCTRCKVEAHEDKVSLPRNRVDHDWRKLYNGVVEQPIRRCRKSIGFGSDTNGRDFCWIEPSDSEPTNGEESVEEEYHDSRCVCTAFRACGKANASYHHAESHPSSVPHHESSSPEPIHNEKSDQSSEEVLCTQNTSQKPGERRIETQRILENHGRICDQIHIRSVREELFDGKLRARCDLIDLLDLINLLSQVFVPSRKPWREGTISMTSQLSGQNTLLEGDRKAPLKGAFVVEPEAVIYPITEHYSACNECTFEEYEKTTNFGGCHLCLPNWYTGCVHAISSASDDSENCLAYYHHLAKRTYRPTINWASHNQSTHEDCASSTELITISDDKERAQETSNLVDGDNKGLNGSFLRQWDHRKMPVRTYHSRKRSASQSITNEPGVASAKIREPSTFQRAKERSELCPEGQKMRRLVIGDDLQNRDRASRVVCDQINLKVSGKRRVVEAEQKNRIGNACPSHEIHNNLIEVLCPRSGEAREAYLEAEVR
ncbi:general substrate transporter, partial [Aureobasidium melanogenum]